MGQDHEKSGMPPENVQREMLDAIHHIAIIASDYEVSKAFYSEVLGFRVIREVWRETRHSWKCDMAIGSHSRIELFSFPNAPLRPSGPEAQGLRHLAFSVADLDAVVAHLVDENVAVEPIRVDEHTGSRFTFFRDPDGLPLELYEVEQQTSLVPPRLTPQADSAHEPKRSIDDITLQSARAVRWNASDRFDSSVR